MRLKKGDEVRSHRDCPFGGFKTGDIFTITAVDGDFIMFVDNYGNSRLRPDDEFELLPVADATGKPAFKVGDRVVALKDSAYSIKKGSISTVIRVDGDHISIRKENGKADGWLAEYFALAPLTTETGKFYRTRDGRKVGPMDGWTSDQFRERAGDGRYWTVDGIGHGEAKGEDLIAEWVDEPSSNDNQPVAEQQEGSVFIDVSKAGPSQLHLAKGRLVKINQGYGFELARYGDYVWVDTGKKQPVVAHINEIKEAA
ncbi:hypothetical protein H7Q97_17865 [Ochrobactrum sp. CM-21-5]|nr:hypothetical protein [Ochrobactrum sp. CM-21-5]MBC2887250.1 hypothetical protein [Ochrobactrum sp. CM-21-5]